MTVDAARWQRVEAALDAVLQAPEADRPALLERLSGDDDELRREVESLLAAHAAAGSFLETTAAAFVAARLLDVPAEPAEPAGAIVGRYRLVEEIGRGGMGAVWLAERADGHFEQRVALKLVKRGMDTDEILARFLRERQILARLEHSHIARLLDGGVSDDGRPYFVMEHVAGEPITEYCDRQRLSIEHRLRLFVGACRAIDHAHRNLVVHRDIKPTNVLVTEDGEVKLLDFGIAKLLGDEDGAATRAAGAASELMTPEYASPEQVAGEPITTASDVYQLGVLLYELLTGHRPHAAAGGPAAIRQRIREATPSRPSTAVRRVETVVHRDGTAETIDPALVSGSRDTTPERLQRRLRGDLDTIAMRALRKEPRRRYPSVEALAEDVERHLEYLPIRFGGDRFSYRAGKFVRRNRLRVATGVILLMLLVGSVAFYTLEIRRERDRARLEAAKSAGSAELMRGVFESWDPDAADRGEVDASAVLRSAVQTAENNLRNQPEMLAASLSILGELFASLDARETADSLLLRALAIQDGQEEPSADLAATLARRGRLLDSYGRIDEGGAALQRAFDLYRGLFGERNVETLRVERDLASNLRARSDFRGAERLLRDVLQSLEVNEANASPFALETATDLGNVLFHQGRYDEAITILRATRERQQRMFGAMYGPSIATTRSLASALRDRGDIEEAESLYREALRTARTLYGEDHRQTAWTTGVLSIVLERKGELEEAERLSRQEIELLTTIFGPQHGHVGHEIMRLGGIRLDRGDPVEGERLLRRGLQILREAFPEGHPDEGDGLNRLAYVLLLRGAPGSDEAYRVAVAFDSARPAESPVFVSDGIHFLAWAEHRKGDLDLAEADYGRALGLYRRQLPMGHAYRADAATGLGAVLLDAGRPAEAERYLREGVAQWERNPSPDASRLAQARALLARATAS